MQVSTRSRNILDRVEGSATLVSQVSHLMVLHTFPSYVLFLDLCTARCSVYFRDASPPGNTSISVVCSLSLASLD